MLTRFVRIQLVIFVIASILGITVMITNYLQAPTLLGVGRIRVTVQMPQSGGLYRFANVTYRGVQIGKVTAMDVDRTGAIATLALDSSPRVPADLRAEVRSVSAVGEQYVDLQPRRESGPYLHDGSVIPANQVGLPPPVAPTLDRLSAMVGAIPKDKLDGLLDESFKAFNGAGYDLQSLIDSTAKISTDARAVSDRATQLIDDAQPILGSQVASAEALRTWSRRLEGISRQLVADDRPIRSVLSTGPAAAQEITRLLNQLKPTLPVLLANLASLSQVAVTYHPGLEQLLVLLPPAAAFYMSATPANNATGIPIGDFRVSIDDPPACTVGFLPPSAWRSPADTTTVDTPDDLFCKLPQDSAIAVRGARNYPCMDRPGKYAPTVQECKSDRPFQPLAARQHALGPYPLDPNLLAQGVPTDERAAIDDNIFGPAAGAPAPGAPAAPTLAQPDNQGATTGSSSDLGAPPIALAPYDPQTGKVAAGGTFFDQRDVVPGGNPMAWQELVLPAAPR